MLFENKHIFIVDDDESVCRALSILLVLYGFTVDTFSSVEKFFLTVSNIVPGWLILDIHMPGLNGWEAFTRMIKSGCRRPVILITADRNAVLKKQAIKIGAMGYLQKPFNDQDLVDLINNKY